MNNTTIGAPASSTSEVLNRAPGDSTKENESDGKLIRCLGFKEAASLVVGSVIGTGVFLKAATMAQTTGSATWVILAWIMAGLLSLAGALCYAELGGMFPKAGGEYVYLREAYGKLPGFLFGWMRFWIGSPGSIAAYAAGSATFLAGMMDIGDNKALVAVGMIAVFTTLNCASVVVGGRVQTFITLLKALMVVGLTLSIFALVDRGAAAVASADSGGAWQGWSAFGAAMLAALWAYDGWNNMPMAAGEIRDPGKNIPRALGLGMFLILGLYVAINLSYFYALPFHEVATASSRDFPDALPVATKATEAAFGPVAVGILSIAFVISALGGMNGSILTGARVPYAMAQDGLFFSKLGSVNETSRTPIVAVIVQGVISCILALSGSFDQLTDYVVFSAWIFYAAVAGSVFIFRQRLPQAERPFRTPAYPILPLVFMVISTLLLLNTLVTAPYESGIGLAFILAGIPVYFWFQRKARA